MNIKLLTNGNGEWQAIIKTGLGVISIRENEVVYKPVRGQTRCQSAVKPLINKGEGGARAPSCPSGPASCPGARRGLDLS